MANYFRIFSDIHYGDRSSQARSLAQLSALLDGPASLVLNGDTLDTRPGPDPAQTAALRAEVQAFFRERVPTVTFLTGNHDADITPQHALDLANGKIFVTHGDVLFPSLVPWSQDAPSIRRRLAEEFAAVPVSRRGQLETQLAVYRRVAISIPQRHQSESNPLRYAVEFAKDTVWPPSRLMCILNSWRQLPHLAATFLQQHRPHAKYIIVGHTHRPGIWRQPNGVVVINTGSFSRPFGGGVVDVDAERVTVRRIDVRRGEFRVGRATAEFALAEAPALADIHPA